ncbi:CbbQ/NirQ/NorQ/GpvN family protein [Aliikangiella sp. IMCC44359]|uniref:CbbQ/NirQ/NorQ/GpvN family protein n=1 Tax=Aliikangiella sp. IMCC44359 TaxID=3459125 RepID=UPI00403B025B
MSEINDSPAYIPQGNEIEVFTAAYENQLPLMLKGPTGCGKTRFVSHMAKKLNKPLYTIACHDDLTAADLVGRYLIEDGQTVWRDGPLTRAVREGGICYLDEVVEARKDTTVVIHPLSDDRRILPIDRTGEQLNAPDSFMLVISYNPGYQNLLKGLKPSTRQRFVSLTFDYPQSETEQSIIKQETGLDNYMNRQLVDLSNSLRRLKDHDLEESISTRLLVYTATLIKAGMNPIAACQAALIEPLSDDIEVVNALMTVVKAKLDID